MLISKTNPKGIDKVISSLQSKIYASLIATWSGDYNSYPRAYRNDTANGFIAEVFTGVDYKEVYFDDTIAALSFFGISGEQTIDESNMEFTNIHLVFMVDLVKIKGISVERLDEETRLDVQKLIDTIGSSLGWTITRISTGVANCLKEYPGTRQSEGLKFRDMHPLHCFRFDLSVNYSPTLINC